MLDDTIINLINKAVDGTLSSKEKSRLDEILSVNEEAQQCYQDLKETVLVLEHVPHLEPPPELKSDVIAQIALSR